MKWRNVALLPYEFNFHYKAKAANVHYAHSFFSPESNQAKRNAWKIPLNSRKKKEKLTNIVSLLEFCQSTMTQTKAYTKPFTPFISPNETRHNTFVQQKCCTKFPQLRITWLLFGKNFLTQNVHNWLRLNTIHFEVFCLPHNFQQDD